MTKIPIGKAGGKIERHREQNRLYMRRWRAQQTARCTVAGCSNRIEARGLCTNHYRRLRKYGDPTAPDQRPAARAARSQFDREKAIERMLAALPDCRTFREAAAKLGVSQQRVNQILTWLLGHPPGHPAAALAELRELAKRGEEGKKP